MKLQTRRNLFFLGLLMITAIIAGVCSCSDTDDDDDSWRQQSGAKNSNRNDNSREPALARLEFPKVKGGNSIVLIYTTNDQYGINYSVEWDVNKKAQRWSCYQMTSDFDGPYGSSSFMEDPDLPASYRLDDSNRYYSGSGFDRGHLCPNADRKYSKLANQQTYYYTNMQPQYHMFNAGPRKQNGDQDWTRKSPWLRMEEQVRVWAKVAANDTLYVVKGGTIEEGQLLMKVKNELLVPKYFFVALLAKNKSGYKALGFWFEHDNVDHYADALGKYVVNVRDLEQKTGIDFFCNLPDETEERVETLPVENVRKAWGL